MEKVLRVFVDESGDTGYSGDTSKYYIVSFVFHNQQDDVSSQLDKVKNKLPLVNKFLDDLYPDENEREFTKLIYRISKDMNHGGGYAFNSSPGLLEAQFEQVKKAIYRYMFRNLLNVSLTYSEHGINIDLKHEIMAFEALASLK